MLSPEIKLRRDIKFYYLNKTNVKVIKDNSIYYGKIKKPVLPMIGSSFSFELSDGTPMIMFLEDISQIYPDSSSIELINNKIEKVRKSIPYGIKMTLWKNYFGERFEASCPLCNSQIQRDNFEAGHKVSVANGGSDDINNLKPICRSCNRGMSDMNMAEYISKYLS